MKLDNVTSALSVILPDVTPLSHTRQKRLSYIREILQNM